MARMYMALDAELHRKARQRASDLGISLAEYIRRLVVKDLEIPQKKVDPGIILALARPKARTSATGRTK